MAVFRVEGRLMGEPEVPLITGAAEEAVADGRVFLLLGLAGVPWMTSGGVGILTAVHKIVKPAGGRVTLLHPSERVRRLLTVTGLIVLFDVYEEEKDALAAFVD